MQLDIFDDSRPTLLRNDVLMALVRRDAGAARSAYRVFAQACAHDDSLAPLALLIDALDTSGASHASPWADHGAARDGRRLLDEQLRPAAQRLLGQPDADAWLAPLWAQAAQRAARLAFRAGHGDDHAAALWLRAGNWPAAIAAVRGIESWRCIPAPLAWMAQARYRLDGLDAVWPLLAELAWRAPRRFGDLAARIADPTLDKLRRRFDASFEGEGEAHDLAWFPAWVLIDTPGLAPVLGQAGACGDEAPERAMRLLLQLLRLERQGRHHELVAHRQRLRDTHALLYSAYMKTR